jgi:NADP-dependent 3-hydroxy acid dehydrogenase YdfG
MKHVQRCLLFSPSRTRELHIGKDDLTHEDPVTPPPLAPARGRPKMTLPLRPTAIVTGAGAGIGRAIARALAQHGCQVWLIGRRQAALQCVATLLPNDPVVVVADLSTEEGLATISRSVPARLDVLVHSAGLFIAGSTATVPATQLQTLTAVNVDAPIRLTTACLPQLRRTKGQVVFINSTAALQAGEVAGAYAASKQALRFATDKMRQDIVGSSVRFLSIYPGRTDTAMQRRVLASEGRTAPPRSLLPPEQIATAMLGALCMDRCAEITDLVIRPRND